VETTRVVRLCVDDVSSVLDVGTGTGIFAEAFASLSLRATRIDPNSELLTVARVAVPGGTFVDAMAEELPFDNAAFDLVFLGHVLHETENPAAALREARRVAILECTVCNQHVSWTWPGTLDSTGRAYRAHPHGYIQPLKGISLLFRVIPAEKRLDSSFSQTASLPGFQRRS